MNQVEELTRYNLKWTNHSNNMLQMFSEQLLNEGLVDVTLSCEGQLLKAHRMVLAACSSYFQELFRIHTTEHPVIILQGVKFSVLQQMIKFMYHGEIKIGDDDLDGLLAISESLLVKGLSRVRREKRTTDTSPTSEIVTLDSNPTSPKLTNSCPKGRKRQKRRNSPKSTSVESHVNGDSDSSNEGLDLPNKIFKSGESRNKGIDDFNKSDPIKQHAHSFSQLNAEDIKAICDDKTIDKQGSKIPRPPNAFMIFATQWRKKLATEHPGESNKEISVRLGNMWKSLGHHTRGIFYTAARKADQDHKAKYPGYYYSPKQARIRKELRGSNSYQRANNSTTQNGNIKGTEPTSVVTVLLPDSSGSGGEEIIPISDIKSEPDSYTIFDDLDDVNASTDIKNSSAESVPTTSREKE